ncbi:hypothetical protein BGC07_03490 [Piscirickettsia litoralis]|uniref:Multidrug resistance protein MdtA-like barrel-sandwich hybrid domain-containing protein n=1 Tax=Piscirickettsia litoralis TaxID=1891921 RepID=A0ABX3A074_9GAMM|nr:hypothetical protein BGC07_03490 [Piscirickettsia litoralis]
MLLVGHYALEWPHPMKAGQKAAQKQRVSVKAVNFYSVPKTVESYGRVTSLHSIALKAQSDGLIESIKFAAGQSVKKGDILFILKTTDTGNQLKKLAAELQLAKQRYLRLKRLSELSKDSVSKIDLIQALTQYQQALSQYEEAQTIHDAISPVNGTVTDTDLSVGDFVSAGDVLAHVITQDGLQIKYQLPSRYVNQVKVGQAVTFSVGNHHYRAIVNYVAPEISLNSQGITLRANFENSNATLPLLHSFGKVAQVINPQFKALALPQALVQTDAQGFYVYIFKNNKVNKTYFSPGSVTKLGLIIVNTGLKKGDLLITTNPDKLSPGQKVRLMSDKAS